MMDWQAEIIGWSRGFRLTFERLTRFLLVVPKNKDERVFWLVAVILVFLLILAWIYKPFLY